jgi:hypothetical protein
VGDWLAWGEITSSLGLGCEGFAGFPGLFDILTGACLVLNVPLGADCSLPLLLVLVTSLSDRDGGALKISWGSNSDNTAPTDNVVPARS